MKIGQVSVSATAGLTARHCRRVYNVRTTLATANGLARSMVRGVIKIIPGRG